MARDRRSLRERLLRLPAPALRRRAPPDGGYFLDRKPADKTDLVEYDFDTSPTLDVPGDWNSQDERLFYYEGTVWYRRRFDYHAGEGKRLFLHFGAANYQADVYLNGKKLGQHLGGFTPFEFEVTGQVRESGNSLVVRVDNRRHLEAVPTVNTDWWNYGGLTRDVRLIETPATFVRDYRVQLGRGERDHIDVSVQLDGPQARQHVVISLPEAGLSGEADTDGSGGAHFAIAAPGLGLWSPGHPRLYSVKLAAGADTLSDKVGFRTIEVKGTDILLDRQVRPRGSQARRRLGRYSNHRNLLRRSGPASRDRNGRAARPA